MIAYDLDGVFINDIHILDNLSELLRIRSENLKPIFTPAHDFVIITGRPNIDEEDTNAWADRFFTKQPLGIFHNNRSLDTAKEYKLKVLKAYAKELNIHTYIESDKEQADYLKKHLWKDIRVLHFEEFINTMIERL
jgi:hypothetical protein